MAAPNRIDRINEEIRRALSDLLRELKDPRLHAGMLSIVRCDTTADLRWCKVYVSAFGVEDMRALKKGLESAKGFLRRELGARVDLRYTPELVFVLDDSIAAAARLSSLLKTLVPEEEGAADDD